ncbi:MAG TPA: rhodanese-like domain-containing protein [Rhizomicrobium sp.]|jgi:rhodanese-related sulfurtransferase
MTQPGTEARYAGDVTPKEAWALLERDPKAQLIDVRSFPEWNFVGVPDLSSLGRPVHRVEWQSFPAMAFNRDFTTTAAESLQSVGAGRESPVLLLCRSGARSRSAAIALTEAGFARALNVASGFEGDVDSAGHRGTLNGWKAAGLAWRQG